MMTLKKKNKKILNYCLLFNTEKSTYLFPNVELKTNFNETTEFFNGKEIELRLRFRDRVKENYYNVEASFYYELNVSLQKKKEIS